MRNIFRMVLFFLHGIIIHMTIVFLKSLINFLTVPLIGRCGFIIHSLLLTCHPWLSRQRYHKIPWLTLFAESTRALENRCFLSDNSQHETSKIPGALKSIASDRCKGIESSTNFAIIWATSSSHFQLTELVLFEPRLSWISSGRVIFNFLVIAVSPCWIWPNSDSKWS